MTDTPETHYARSADGTNLAYQVSGDGPLELVFYIASGVPIDLLSEDPGFIRVRRRLDSFSRALWFDGRGSGLNVWFPNGLEKLARWEFRQVAWLGFWSCCRPGLRPRPPVSRRRMSRSAARC